MNESFEYHQKRVTRRREDGGIPRSIISCLIIFSIAFVGVFLTLILSFCIFTFEKDRNKSTTSIQYPQKTEYEFTRLNLEENRVNSGFVFLKKELREDDFIFRDNLENGDLLLISNFDSPKFYCSGSCYCYQDDGIERRSIVSDSSRLFLKGLSYLLIAVSSTKAYEIAKEYFDERCRSENCPNDHLILSEVEQCDNLDHQYKFEIIEDDASVSGIDFPFKCKGKCRKNEIVLSNDEIIKFWKDSNDCQDFELDGVVNIFLPTSSENSEFESMDNLKNNAKEKFHDKLEVFCSKQGESVSSESTLCVANQKSTKCVTGDPREPEITMVG